MQTLPTSVEISADAYRQALLADANRVRPFALRDGAGSIAATSSGPEQRGERRVLVALCVASFMVALNFLATTPFSTSIADDLGSSVAMLGQVVTMMSVISAMLGLIVGPLADRYGYRWPLVIGLIAVAVNLTVSGLAPAFSVLLGVSAVSGLGDAIVFGIPLAIAGTRFTGEARRKAIGWTIGSLSSGAIVGVPLLTAIGSVAGWRGALLVAGLGALAAAVFVARALPADGRRPAQRWQLRDLLTAYAPLVHHTPTLRLYASSALRAAFWFGLLTYLGAYLADELGLAARQIGCVYTLGGIGYAVGSVAAGSRIGRFSPRLLLGSASLVAALALVLMTALSNITATVGLLPLVAAASAAGSIAVATMLASESPAGSGTTMVLNGSVLNFGGALGAASGGLLIAAGGYAALGAGFALCAAAGAVLAWWPAPRHNRREALQVAVSG